MTIRRVAGLTIISVVCLSLAACQGVPDGGGKERKIDDEKPIEKRGDGEERKVAKPDWWPKGSGVKWPPPKPEGWDGPWPPGPPDKDDPGWWAKHYRGDGKRPGKDNPPKKDGDLGSAAFAQGFDAINSIFMPRKDDCGIFYLHRDELRVIQSCTPYPGKLIGQLCDIVVDAKAAEAECLRECAQRPRTKCPMHRLYKPEAYVGWGCDPGKQVGGLPFPTTAACAADYLCECWSD